VQPRFQICPSIPSVRPAVRAPRPGQRIDSASLPLPSKKTAPIRRQIPSCDCALGMQAHAGLGIRVRNAGGGTEIPAPGGIPRTGVNIIEPASPPSTRRMRKQARKAAGVAPSRSSTVIIRWKRSYSFGLEKPCSAVESSAIRRNQTSPKNGCTSTRLPGSTGPLSSGSTMKQLAWLIEVRMPEPC
jgi:hypothetical protein